MRRCPLRLSPREGKGLPRPRSAAAAPSPAASGSPVWGVISGPRGVRQGRAGPGSPRQQGVRTKKKKKKGGALKGLFGPGAAEGGRTVPASGLGPARRAGGRAVSAEPAAAPRRSCPGRRGAPLPIKSRQPQVELGLGLGLLLREETNTQ